MQKLRVLRLSENARLPKRMTPGSAGYDLFALLNAPLVIRPGESVTVPTGIAIALPGPEFAAFVFARSGLAVKHGVALSNGVGVIDSDYRGEIKVGLVNLSQTPYSLEPFERIAQMVIAPVLLPDLLEADTLDETERAAGGFGSSGRI